MLLGISQWRFPTITSGWFCCKVCPQVGQLSKALLRSIAVDLSKAFDSLPHGLLVDTLFAYGVALSACKLLCSYLHNRHQRVKIHDAKSEWLSIEKGGPLLFNIFINDIFSIDNDVTISICRWQSSVYHMLTIILTSSTIFWNAMLTKCCIGLRLIRWKSILQNSRICSWKTKVPNDEDLNIIVDNDTINLTDSLNVLCITIDDTLNFNSHVSNMCNRAVDSWMFCND